MAIVVSRMVAEAAMDDADFQSGARRVDEALQSTERNARSVERSFRDLYYRAGAIRDVGRLMTIGLTAPIAAIGGGAIKAAMDMEVMRKELQSVTHNASETERQLVRLREVAKLPGLGFPEAVEGSVRLQAAGMSARMAERSLLAFGTALASVGKGRQELEEVIMVLTKMQAVGKITAREIMELSIRLPQIRAVMRDAFGTASTEDMQKSGISVQEFTQKVISSLEKLNKGANLQSVRNDFENLRDTVQQSMARIGESMLPVVSDMVNKLAPAVEKVADAFTKLPRGTQLAIAGTLAVTATLGPLIAAVGMVVDGYVKTRAGWALLRDLSGTVTTAMNTVTAATVAQSTATTASTVAQTAATVAEEANTVALGQGTTANAAYLAARAQGLSMHEAYAAAVAAETAAIEANTAAMAQNAGASALAKGAAAGGRFLGMPIGSTFATGLTVAGTAGAAATGLLVGSAALAWMGGELGSAVDTENELGKQGRQFGKENPYAARAAQLSQRLSRLRARGGTMADPLFRQTAQELEQVRRQGTQASFAKRGMEDPFAPPTISHTDQMRIADLQYEAQLTRTEAGIATTGKTEDAQTSMRALTPIIRQRNQVLTQRAKEIGDVSKANAKQQEEYWRIQHEIAQNEEKIGQLQKRSNDERQQNSERAARTAREIRGNQWRAAIEQAESRGETGDVHHVAISRETMLRPVLIARLRDTFANLQRAKQGTEEYAQLEREYYDTQHTLSEMRANSVKEATRNSERVKREEEHNRREEERRLRERASEAIRMLHERNREMQRGYKEEEETGKTRFKMQMELIGSDPFINPQQRRLQMTRMAIQRFGELSQGRQPWETERESLERQYEAAHLRKEIYQEYGAGRYTRTIGGGAISMASPRVLRELEREMSRASGDTERRSRARHLAYEAANQRPIILQAVLDRLNTGDEMKRQLMAWLNSLGDLAFPHQDVKTNY